MDSASLQSIDGRWCCPRVCVALPEIHRLAYVSETWQSEHVRQHEGSVSVHRPSKQHAVHIQYVAPSLSAAFAERLDREDLHRLVVDLQHPGGCHLPRQHDGDLITSCR